MSTILDVIDMLARLAAALAVAAAFLRWYVATPPVPTLDADEL